MEKPKFISVGARTLKTALAVFICLLIDYFILQTSNFYSSFAAILCMTPTTEESITAGINRTIGTLASGVFSGIVLTVFNLYPRQKEIIQVFLLPLFIILIIEFFVLIDRPGAINISCAVFLVLSLGPIVDMDYLFTYIFIRVFETVIGIVVSVAVNHFVVPYNRKES